MFFHVDESGNTGNHLFDNAQPTLSYGVLSSKLNVDALGRTRHATMLRKLAVTGLHASQLGVSELTKIAQDLVKLQQKFQFRFDYYFIHKPTYALVILFDSVFDAGLNPAVKWDMYWTPMRFMTIYNLSHICDEDLLKTAWSLCTAKNIEKRSDEIIALLSELQDRIKASKLDKRTKELFDTAFQYGIANPQKLDFGCPDQKIVSPNAVGFQFVLSSMARRLRIAKRKDALSIKVDRQAEFNPAQAGTHYMQQRISDGLAAITGDERRAYLDHPLYVGMGDEEMLRKGMPKREIKFAASESSIGLQIVDIYLWITNRAQSGATLSDELKYLRYLFQKNINIDGISMDGMRARWNAFEQQLPTFEDITNEQHDAVQDSIDNHRETIRNLNI